ncbi:MAG: hypothetical protein MHM6MM_007321, partial [Cercozoa sp. M6MM]
MLTDTQVQEAAVLARLEELLTGGPASLSTPWDASRIQSVEFTEAVEKLAALLLTKGPGVRPDHRLLGLNGKSQILSGRVHKSGCSRCSIKPSWSRFDESACLPSKPMSVRIEKRRLILQPRAFL